MHWEAAGFAKALVLSIFLLPTPPLSETSNSLYPLNAVAWSLAFEIVINVLYAACHRYLTTALLLGTMAISAVLLVFFTFSVGEIDLGWNWPTLFPGLARVFYSFPTGILVHQIWRRGGLEMAPSILWLLVLTVAIFWIGLPTTARLTFSLIAIVFVFPLITLAAVQSPIRPRLARPFAFLGVTSYAVYALHRPLLSVVNGICQVLHVRPAEFAPAIGIPFILALLGLCWLIDLLYDRPIRKWLTSTLQGRSASRKSETLAT